MEPYDIIATKFHSTIEAISMSVDDLAPAIESAGLIMSECLLKDGKIIACGNGADGALAQIFVSHLLANYDQDRPALPALALSNDSASVAAIARSSGVTETYARQIRALGKPDDVLLCVNSSSITGNLVRAVQSAHQGNMRAVILSNTVDDELCALVRDSDAIVRIDARHSASVLELQLIALHCLCALLDHNLFGTHPE